jgi:hypothetical protein
MTEQDAGVALFGVPSQHGIVLSAEAAEGREGVAGAAGSFSNGGGRLLGAIRVHLIFWGSTWNALPAPTPTVGECTNAVLTILASDYMNSLSQYGVGHGSLGSVTVVADAVGGSPASPPNPFTDDDVWGLVEHLRAAGRIPAGDIGNTGQGLYLVVMPTGVAASNPGVIGEHSYYWFGSPATNVPFAWVTQNSLDLFSEVFSHELVEACTDPEGTGWTSVTACGTGHGGWCEIGDVCQGDTARVNGVLVQRYWSNSDARCVVPDDAKVQQDNKDHKDRKDVKDHKDHKDWPDTKRPPKENKDAKDGAKDKESHKEIKDGGKEKELERPGPAGDAVSQLRALVQQLDALITELAAGAGGSPGSARQAGGQTGGNGGAASFIEPAERPYVGAT